MAEGDVIAGDTFKFAEDGLAAARDWLRANANSIKLEHRIAFQHSRRLGEEAGDR